MTPPVDINLNSLVLFLGATQGWLFSVLLLFKRQEVGSINRHLAVLLFSISTEIGHQFLLQTGLIFQLRPLTGLTLPLDALVGVALYWYVRTITHPELDHSLRRVLKHYSIFGICLLLSTPYWGMPFEDRLQMMQTGVIPDAWPPLVYYATLLQVPIKIVSFTLYLALAVCMLIRHRRRINDVFSYHERVTLNWLSLMLVLFTLGLINGLVVLTFFQAYADSTQVMGFMNVFSMVAVFYLGIMGLMQPAIYQHPEQSYLEEEQTAGIDTTEQSSKYRKSSLSGDDMSRIAKKLKDRMQHERLYLDAGLTMPKLATAIGVSPNYLSQTLNTVYEASFFDYINDLRVKHAKILLADPGQQNLAIVDVAMAAGFNSRSTFYSAFKQSIGVTPAQYRRNPAAYQTAG